MVFHNSTNHVNKDFIMLMQWNKRSVETGEGRLIAHLSIIQNEW